MLKAWISLIQRWEPKRWYLRQPPHLSSGVCFVERRWPENAWLWVLRWWGTPLIELNGYVQCNRIWCSWSWVFKNRVYNFTTGWPFAQKPLNDCEGWWWGVYICGETKLKKEAHIHHPTDWPVPHTCAQPYHPGRGSHGQLFCPFGWCMCFLCFKFVWGAGQAEGWCMCAPC